jgi:hypothetical protein
MSFSSSPARRRLIICRRSTVVTFRACIDNEPVQVLNYWKNPGDHATFQKLTSNYGTAAALAAEISPSLQALTVTTPMPG